MLLFGSFMEPVVAATSLSSAPKEDLFSHQIEKKDKNAVHLVQLKANVYLSGFLFYHS